MKNMKKVASFLLVLVMVLGLATTAFAVDTTGSITVDNPRDGQNYTAYKIFDVVYNEGKTAYAYTIDKDATGSWFNDVVEYMGSTWNATEKKYDHTALAPVDGVYGPKNGIKLTPSATDSTKYIVEITKADFSAADFAKFMKAKTTGKTGIELEKTGNIAKKEGLALGYYFVTSTSGALCNLTTTNANVTIHDKNDFPFAKTADKTTVEIGEDVTYTIKGKVPDTTGFTSYDYVITDKMDFGLTLDKTSIEIYISENETLDKAADTKLENPADADKKYYYIVTDGAKTFDGTGDVDFRVNFYPLNMKSMVGKYIFITYTAKVNDFAVELEWNDAHLTYSNDPTDNTKHGTDEDKKAVYTAKIVIDKYAKNSENEQDKSVKLAGAQFKLYKKDNENNKLYYKYVKNEGSTVADVQWGAKAESDTVITDDTGAAFFKGLADGTYYLEEIEAPAGYNLLDKDVEITINGQAATDDDPVSLTHTEGVANSTGSLLPDTGGMGTTIFYVVGSILLFGAVVLLVTKKRMSVAK